MKHFFALICTAAIALCSACQTNPQSTEINLSKAGVNAAFVEVDGGQFLLAGQPYYFVGANFWYGAYLGATVEGRERLVQELDQLHGLGVNNLRVLAGSEQSKLSMAVSPAVLREDGSYDEQLLQGLDFLLAEMGKRNMKAVLYFTNFWQWSGGMAQWVAWDKNELPHDPDRQGDWNAFMQYSAQFYSCESCKQGLLKFIESLIQRRNSITGALYIDDATIMSWQLANEPRPGSDAGGHLQYEAFKTWLHETAGAIKALAPRQLVSTGSEGAMGTSGHIEWFEESHASPNIDYLTFHLWPKNWSWYNAQDHAGTFAEALVKTKAYILQHIEVAKRLQKPIVLEEFGMERDLGAFELTAKTTARDDFLASIFDLLEQQIKIGAPVGGSNVWAWGGMGRAQRESALWQPGEPFTGDPPQEPQGLNSIFDGDTSTLKILAEHAAVLRSLAKQ